MDDLLADSEAESPAPAEQPASASLSQPSSLSVEIVGLSSSEDVEQSHSASPPNVPNTGCRTLSFTNVNGRDTHTPEPVARQHKLVCSICAKEFPRMASLKRHAKFWHHVPCSERTCRRRFTKITLMKSHVAESHGVTTGSVKTAPDNAAPGGKPSTTDQVKYQYRKATNVDILDKMKPARTFVNDVVVHKNIGVTGPKKAKRGRPRTKDQTCLANAASSSSPTSSLAEKDDTKCEQCGKQIPDFEEFCEHINIDHTESCSNCSMAFVHEFYLREHKYSRHGYPRPPIAERPPSPPSRSRGDKGQTVSPPRECDDDANNKGDDADGGVNNDSSLSDISPLALVKRLKGSYRIPKLKSGRSVVSVAPSAVASVSKASVCLECRQVFATSEALKQHVDTHYKGSAQSSGARLEQACHLCGKKFARDRIAQHLALQHPDGQVPLRPPAPVVSAAAPHQAFVCDLCGLELRYVIVGLTLLFVFVYF